MAFDCYAAFPFQIHVVEHLGLHVLGGDRCGIFKKAVGKSRFAVVDMRYYAEVPNIFHRLCLRIRLQKYKTFAYPPKSVAPPCRGGAT